MGPVVDTVSTVVGIDFTVPSWNLLKTLRTVVQIDRAVLYLKKTRKATVFGSISVCTSSVWAIRGSIIHISNGLTNLSNIRFTIPTIAFSTFPRYRSCFRHDNGRLFWSIITTFSEVHSRCAVTYLFLRIFSTIYFAWKLYKPDME